MLSCGQSKGVDALLGRCSVWGLVDITDPAQALDDGGGAGEGAVEVVSNDVAGLALPIAPPDLFQLSWPNPPGSDVQRSSPQWKTSPYFDSRPGAPYQQGRLEFTLSLRGEQTLLASAGQRQISKNYFDVLQALADQPAEIRERNARFVQLEARHILLINPQGYAAPSFPFSARDCGGQIDYVNEMARTMAGKGYKVTIAARSFAPDEKYIEYGERLGVEFMPDTDDRVRYVYVPGIGGSRADFLPKEEIYRDLEPLADNLAKLLSAEASARGLDPWDPRSVYLVNSHYIDGGIVGQLLVRKWHGIIAAKVLEERLRPIIGGPVGGVKLDSDALLDNINYYAGMAVIEAYQNAHGGGKPQLIQGLSKDTSRVIEWAGGRLGLSDEKLLEMNEGIAKASQRAQTLAPLAVDAAAVGRRLLDALDEDLKLLRRVLKAINRHAFVPHSLGALKRRNMSATGQAQAQPQKYHELNIFVRETFEEQIMRRKFDPLRTGLPPASMLVETSPEIGSAAFYEGRSERKPTIHFVPGTDGKNFFPRRSVDEPDVMELFEYLENAGGVPESVVEQMRQNPETLNIILEASRLDRTKRKPMVVDAFAALPAELRQSTYVFITGLADDNTREVHDELTGRIDAQGMSDRVFVVGKVPAHLIGTFLGLPYAGGSRTFASALYMTPSSMEGWGMAAQNAAVGRLPVIASRFVPLALYLHAKGPAAAYVVWDDNLASYTEALQWGIENPQPASDMADKATPIVSKHTWENGVETFMAAVDARLQVASQTAVRAAKKKRSKT